MFKTPEQLFGLVMTNPNQIKRDQQLVANAFIGLSTELIALKKENDNLKYFSFKTSESQENILNIETLDIPKENIKEFEDFFNLHRTKLSELIGFLFINKDKLSKTATIGPEKFNMIDKIDKTRDTDVIIGTSDDAFSKTPNEFYNMDFGTKRKLNQQSTDFVSNKFLVNKSKYLHFIISAINLLNDTINQIKEIANNFDDIDIIMKGGNLLKLLFEKISKDLNSEINDYLQTKFGNNFSSSDFDFDFKFKPHEGIDQAVYDNQRVFVSNLITIYIISLRNILFENKEYFFDFYNLNKKAQEKLIAELIEKYNEAIKEIVKDDKKNSTKTGKPIQYSNLDGAKVVSLIYDLDNTNNIIYTTQGEQTIRTTFSKKDYCIINDSKLTERSSSRTEFYLMDYNNYLKRLGFNTTAPAPQLIDIVNSISGASSNFFYNTTNINIHFLQARFSLFRIKVNFIGKIKFTDGTYKLIQLPGELLDVSLAKNNDYKLTTGKPEFYTKFLIKNINKVVTVQSHVGLINELTVMLFNETNFKPWSELKYEKRLIRLLLLLTLKLLYGYDNILFNDKIIFCEKFLASINNDFSDLNLTTNEHIIFSESFSLFYISLKESFNFKSDPEYSLFFNFLNNIFKKMINVMKLHYNLSLKKGNVHKIKYLDGFK